MGATVIIEAPTVPVAPPGVKVRIPLSLSSTQPRQPATTTPPYYNSEAEQKPPLSTPAAPAIVEQSTGLIIIIVSRVAGPRPTNLLEYTYKAVITQRDATILSRYGATSVKEQNTTYPGKLRKSVS
ncbi:hypothetical protein VE02_10307 [Pseudogymnoascus sp. 03VT05]|nr:hypothetical protein VE02_10307 [Pseudogymnoascus sp. 03VT05]